MKPLLCIYCKALAIWLVIKGACWPGKFIPSSMYRWRSPYLTYSIVKYRHSASSNQLANWTKSLWCWKRFPFFGQRRFLELNRNREDSGVLLYLRGFQLWERSEGMQLSPWWLNEVRSVFEKLLDDAYFVECTPAQPSFLPNVSIRATS